MQEQPVTRAQRLLTGLNLAFFFTLVVAAVVVARMGHYLDARDGRDVLAGFAGGAAISLLIGTRWVLQAAAGHTGPAVELSNVRVYEGPWYGLGLFSSIFAFQTTFNAMWCVFAIVGLKRLLKNAWLVGIAASLFFTVVAASGLYTDQAGVFGPHFALAVAVVSVIVGMTIRFGPPYPRLSSTCGPGAGPRA